MLKDAIKIQKVFMLSQLFIKPVMWPQGYTFYPYDLHRQPHPVSSFIKCASGHRARGPKALNVPGGGGVVSKRKIIWKPKPALLKLALCSDQDLSLLLCRRHTRPHWQTPAVLQASPQATFRNSWTTGNLWPCKDKTYIQLYLTSPLLLVTCFANQKKSSYVPYSLV